MPGEQEAAALGRMDDQLEQLKLRNGRRAALFASLNAALPDLMEQTDATCRGMSATQALLTRRRTQAGRLLRSWIARHDRIEGWPAVGSLTPLLDGIREDGWRRWVRFALWSLGILVVILAGLLIWAGSPRATRPDCGLRWRFWQFCEPAIDYTVLSVLLILAGALVACGATWLRWRHRRDAAGRARDLKADLRRIVLGGGRIKDSILTRMIRSTDTD